MTFRGKNWASAGVVGMICAVAFTGISFADDPPQVSGSTVAPLLWLPAMHVFRRHSVEAERQFEFYSDVLGFARVGNIGAVGRVQTGASEFKLQKRPADSPYIPGGPRAATGFRLVGLYFADEAALAARFKQHGLPAPEFRAVPGSKTRVALADDPDGQPVELIVVPERLG